MRSKVLFLIFGTCFLFLLTSCQGGQPTCADADLMAPVLSSPTAWERDVSLTPDLLWDYPDDSCSPQSYRIILRSGPFFNDDLGGSTGDQSTVWFPGEALRPGTEYAWSVQGVNGTHLGPASGDNHFFTGPSCAADSLKIPDLMSPANNMVFDGDPAALTLTWSYPDTCMPGDFVVQLGTGAGGFSSSQTVTSWSTNWKPIYLNDCTNYYWHVRADAPSEEDQNDWVSGDWSEIRTFRVDYNGTCAPQVQGMIRGTVWQDQCALPDDALPDPLPLGCVPASGGGATPNGTYDPGEPGIGGLVVSLATGACPSSTIIRGVPTYSQGSYSFYWIPAGTYCVGVDAADPLNMPTLAPGTWSAPATTDPLASRTVIVEAGEDAKNTDFGWWYQFGNGWGDTNASVYGMVWHDLCAMTPTSDPPAGPLEPGCALDGWGMVHADGIRQADEPGIEGVVVDIGPGDCPSAGLATAITDANGYYHFSDLPAGKYCLRIDPAHNPTNTAILLPGSWTVMPSGHEGMTFRAITLTAATTLPGQDFGWDYDNALQDATPVLLPADIQPGFTLTINANCREGPDVRYNVVTPELAGQSFPIIGRNAEDNWYFIQLTQNMRCWFSNSVGIASGDLSDLHVFYGLPLPTDTPPPTCSDYTDRSSCGADPACTWAFTAAGPGYCKAK